ncbi:aminotransferase-like domain-containing protein [Cochlodiniinecator piscidefendens]|uniref:aminotransferase-like domain-containing protein n=1 Tax=Cochlodiniinecator piscidefendens TaxID=2715756 RepID=UPI00140A701F|nr:PLP-dependent aminotransferase family protein [Cochlodiniinecator piscidefendens]
MAQKLNIDRSQPSGLRDQIVSQISRLIFEGLMPTGLKLSSCRELARELDVSINTVISAYRKLEEEQLIEARPRSGYFVSSERGMRADIGMPEPAKIKPRASIGDKLNKLRRAEDIETIFRPNDWYSYEFPFVCNQIDESSFPVAEWRECTRLAMNRKDLKIWSADGLYADCAELIEQVAQRILPRRGIFEPTDSILITLGTQNGLFITSLLFGGRDRIAAMEDPGYPDARKILRSNFGSVRFQPVDKDGMIVDERLRGVDLVFITPNRQFPTTVTMSESRRHALLQAAEEYDFYIVEDDYECDVDYRPSTPLPLHSLDKTDRLIYLGSLSKGLSPGLRLGYLTAPPEFIEAARDCRGMMFRHPPMILQHTAATFIRLGYYDGLLRRVRLDYEQRWHQANAILRDRLPSFVKNGEFGGTNFILADHETGLDAVLIAKAALKRDVIVEPILPCFSSARDGSKYFRLGVSSINRELIESGIDRLCGTIKELQQDRAI